MDLDGVQIIIPNLNRRFSGITSTIIAVVPEQQKSMRFASVGHFIDGRLRHMSWREFFRLTAKPLANGKNRVFHCRRNIEMVCGLFFKYVLRRKITLIFTSTAQRRHTWLTKFLYRRMEALITTSPRAASFLVRKPDAVIAHGVNPAVYFPAAEGEPLPQYLPPSRRFVGIFGRVREQKGVREFVSAMCGVLGEFPDVDAVICGETTPKFIPFEKEMKALIQSRGFSERFHWLGKVPFGDIPPLFRSMSVVMCVSRNEGFGLTCLEAMASGAPVVATRAGAFDMVVRDGVDGFIVDCGDARAMEEKLRAMLADPARLADMGRSARERVLSSFTIEKEAAALNAVYKKFVG